MSDAVAPTLQATLGQVRVVANEAGRAVIEYEVGPHMCHSGGVAQGGFVCGWIDAAMAHASISLLPAQGVYAGRAITQAGNWPAAINIGPNPTFGEHALKVEVHLIDFAGSLYGQPLEVDFLSRLRSIQPFDSVAALKSQLARDVAAARQIAAAEPAEDEDADG